MFPSRDLASLFLFWQDHHYFGRFIEEKFNPTILSNVVGPLCVLVGTWSHKQNKIQWNHLKNWQTHKTKILQVC